MMNKTQDVRLQLKELNDDDYTFVGYGNTFNELDQVRDITLPGAFAKSIEQHKADGTKPKMLWQHDPHQPIGVWTEVTEDEHGLKMVGQLTKGVKAADEAYALLKAGALDGLSIGYVVVDEEYDAKSNINYLREVSLKETSLVTFPCNESSRVAGVAGYHRDKHVSAERHASLGWARQQRWPRDDQEAALPWLRGSIMIDRNFDRNAIHS